eukprot:TRINITY_DN3998_c0_g1_i2.p1 TRINITY_DN3998_c0_g1~~TRINITY_DN3998_c0_g1_i2.p1  ORF type:complete len:542 (-),score=83.49 TRINITY_DN3998_c0_g1_i2:214-1839(-)
MRVIGLISGGKDSCFNLVHCVAAGHNIVALANLKPKDRNVDELDSQMYQTVGTSAIEFVAQAMDLPLYVGDIAGSGTCVGRDYNPTEGDEVEDLYELLKKVSAETGAEGVSVGAILSDYQRVRVESVCLRLNLTPLAYLWRRNQSELLNEMIRCGLESVLIKVACLGLNSSHLGQTLQQMEPTLLKLEKKFGVNVCGEGGEYETFTLDSPLFKKKLKIVEKTCFDQSTDPFAPVSYLHLDSLELVDKDVPQDADQAAMLRHHLVQGITSEDYLSDLSESVPSKIEADSDTLVNNIETKNMEPEIINDSIGEGWFDIVNIHGFGDTPENCMRNAADLLTKTLQKVGATSKDLVRTTVFIDTMENYGGVNRVYCQQFDLNPPVRICVALGPSAFPSGCGLSMNVRGWRGEEDRRCLHVQGISHWAPPNIGPYSQGYLVQDKLHVSGQIGLVPGTMTLHQDLCKELALAYRHVNRVIEALGPANTIKPLHTAICYITDVANTDLVNSFWRGQCVSEPLQIYLVSQLPRMANFEFEVVSNVELNE